MKLLILQLSDIHIRYADDIILARTENIIDAIKNVDTDIAAVVCVLNGDTSFSGEGDQYVLAIDFVAAVTTELRRHFPEPCLIRFVAVPGNHDCNFTEATEARTLISEVVTKTPSRLKDTSFADICLGPQSRYFEFRGALDLPERSSLRDTDDRLYSEYMITVNGGTVSFCCCNSAVLSELHEKPGTLIFPAEIIPSGSRTADVSVGIIHHPFNWFRPDCAREVRNRLESITDFILTGHEHVLDRRAASAHGSNNTFLEAGVLQDRDNADRSEFYAIVLDTTAKKQRVIGYSWADGAYSPTGGDDPSQYHLWEDFAQNRFRIRETFQVSPEFTKFRANNILRCRRSTALPPSRAIRDPRIAVDRSAGRDEGAEIAP